MQREMLVDEAQRNWVEKEVEGEVKTGNKDENNTHLIRTLLAGTHIIKPNRICTCVTGCGSYYIVSVSLKEPGKQAIRSSLRD